jgi:hypothetical protein
MGFGSKWKLFFCDLELYDNLNVDNPRHLWLLHHLYLPEINRDAQDWAGAWNNHTVGLRGQRGRSPKDMFFFGMLENGHRGIEGFEADLTDDEIVGYGIDWEAMGDPQIRTHHNNANLEHSDDIDDQTLPVSNTSSSLRPERFSVVEVESPNCPLTPEQVHWLDSQLLSYPFSEIRTVEAYRLRWITALALCLEIFAL